MKSFYLFWKSYFRSGGWGNHKMPIGPDLHVLNMYLTKRIKFFFGFLIFVLNLFWKCKFCLFPLPYLFGKKEFKSNTLLKIKSK